MAGKVNKSIRKSIWSIMLYRSETEEPMLDIIKVVVHDISLKATPCKSLWVVVIGPSVTKEELEEQFLKFGKIHEFKFIRDRNTAFAEGKPIGGDQIRVDYLRSHPSRREQLPDFHDAREGQFFSSSMGLPDSPWMPKDFPRNYSEPAHYGVQKATGKNVYGASPSNET